MLKCMARGGCSWPLAFGAIVWSLWLNQNALAFYVESVSWESVLYCGQRIVEQFSLAAANSMMLSCRSVPRLRDLVRWVPLMVRWFKLNTVGSRCTNSGYASCGGVVHDDRGT
ncbi:hypothetical protein V6N12_076325 [Hibiscus sabdariffa]|uniref:Secreted protein n=1 Tax=Hibiscus sabdariffa TaxID=183260 RepID=A0ABR2D9H4_9ROSI